MPYRTEYGKHYHEEYGCHGATIPCDTKGLAPCSNCCGSQGAGTTGISQSTSDVGSSAMATVSADAPNGDGKDDIMSDGESSPIDVRQGSDTMRIGASAVANGIVAPSVEAVPQQDIVERLPQVMTETKSLTPEEEYQRQWQQNYNKVVSRSSEAAYDYCMVMVEDTGEFPDFDTAFDDISYSLRNVRMLRGTEWMIGTGFGLGYARALVECKDVCDVREGIRGISEYMQIDAASELTELGL